MTEAPRSAELVVHQLPGAWGLPSISPFCLKLDAYLRIAGVPFRAVVDATPFKGPKGKLPFIEHEGRRIGDSQLIIEYLEARLGCEPAPDLAPAERAVARAMRALIEENLYWAMIHERWMVDANWRRFRDIVLGGVPLPARWLVGLIARHGVRRQYQGHGMGLHTPEEILAIGCGDIRAVAAVLGDRPFLLGERASAIDATVYGFLANIAGAPFDGPLKREVLRHPALVNHLRRIESCYFGDASPGYPS